VDLERPSTTSICDDTEQDCDTSKDHENDLEGYQQGASLVELHDSRAKSDGLSLDFRQLMALFNGTPSMEDIEAEEYTPIHIQVASHLDIPQSSSGGRKEARHGPQKITV
jgi:hypothetical protein